MKARMKIRNDSFLVLLEQHLDLRGAALFLQDPAEEVAFLGHRLADGVLHRLKIGRLGGVSSRHLDHVQTELRRDDRAYVADGGRESGAGTD